MTQHEAHESLVETLNMGKRQFIDRCMDWLDEFNAGKPLKINNFMECPLALYVAENKTKCARETVALTAMCPICNLPMCPDCGNHNVDVISRVTGYLSTVGGWNASKKQEFEDRNRYNLDENR